MHSVPDVADSERNRRFLLPLADVSCSDDRDDRDDRDERRDDGDFLFLRASLAGLDGLGPPPPWWPSFGIISVFSISQAEGEGDNDDLPCSDLC